MKRILKYLKENLWNLIVTFGFFTLAILNFIDFLNEKSDIVSLILSILCVINVGLHIFGYITDYRKDKKFKKESENGQTRTNCN